MKLLNCIEDIATAINSLPATTFDYDVDSVINQLSSTLPDDVILARKKEIAGECNRLSHIYGNTRSQLITRINKIASLYTFPDVIINYELNDIQVNNAANILLEQIAVELDALYFALKDSCTLNALDDDRLAVLLTYIDSLSDYVVDNFNEYNQVNKAIVQHFTN